MAAPENITDSETRVGVAVRRIALHMQAWFLNSLNSMCFLSFVRPNQITSGRTVTLGNASLGHTVTHLPGFSGPHCPHADGCSSLREYLPLSL